ncbi:MAG: hypothetical protein H6617_11915 [Bdellovibrionaceae bacterium]|nr:hypothetical protein [Pseudobdellovibrionaceae bacterium]
MLRSKTLPAEHFPAYFSLETGADTAQVAPVVQALNQLGESLLIHAHRIAASAIPAFFEASQQAAVLGGLGFSAQMLEMDEQERFYQLLPTIMENRGRLTAVRTLGELYFGKIQISRGRPFRRDALLAKKGATFRLCDQEDKKDTVFVRLSKPIAQARIDEFLKNTTLLIPAGFSVLVMPPIAPVLPKENRLSLAKPIALQQRRL